MHLWTPSRDEPELLAWWGPLLLVARLAREEAVPWPIHIDQFDLLGRVDRSGSRLPVWVYRHHRSGGDIYADPTGQTYQFRPTPKAAGPGRFDRCDVRASVCLAGLPEVVEAVSPENDSSLEPWAAQAHRDSMATHPTSQFQAGRRAARTRVARQDRWLHVVPAIPA